MIVHSTELTHCSHSGEHASVFFAQLPSQQDYPDYYRVIPKPISLKEITAKVKARGYASPHAFVTDVNAMIANAKYYNEQGSIVWNDADLLEVSSQRRQRSGTQSHSLRRLLQTRAETSQRRRDSFAPQRGVHLRSQRYASQRPTAIHAIRSLCQPSEESHPGRSIQTQGQACHPAKSAIPSGQ